MQGRGQFFSVYRRRSSRNGVSSVSCSTRVQDDRACAFSQMALSFNYHTLVPALQQVSNALMTSRNMLGRDAVQPPHPSGPLTRAM